jgi:hypothetical protein
MVVLRPVRTARDASAGIYSLLCIILSTTCESDPLEETRKLMQKFTTQEQKQGITVDSVIDGYNKLQNDSCTSQTDRNSSYSTLVNAYYGESGPA